MHKRSSIEVPIHLISLGRDVPARVYRLTLGQRQREALGSKECYRVESARYKLMAFVTAEIASLPGWGLDVEDLNRRLFRVSRRAIRKLESNTRQKTSITSAA